MLKDFSSKNMNDTLELVQGFYNDNKGHFIKLKNEKDIFRFVVTLEKMHIYLYTKIKKSKIIGVALYVHDRYYLNYPFLSLSYAVEEKYRRKGIASNLINVSLNVVLDDLKPKSKKAYIVTYVALDNAISQKLSRRFISKGSEIITDTMTGEKQHQYVKLLS